MRDEKQLSEGESEGRKFPDRWLTAVGAMLIYPDVKVCSVLETVNHFSVSLRRVQRDEAGSKGGHVKNSCRAQEKFTFSPEIILQRSDALSDLHIGNSFG